jgi:multiple sugar transport system permease protein
MHSTTRTFLARTGQYALALLLAVYSAFPIYYMIICSFREPAVFYTSRSLLPTSFTLDYYRTLIRRTDFLLQFWNSIIVATATVAVTLIVSIMVAYSVSRFKIRGKRRSSARCSMPTCSRRYCWRSRLPPSSPR